ncbi:translational GTPase TypA, partial [Acinetobacter baumannii]
EEQLDFPVIYASGLNGYASLDPETREGNMEPLVDAILKYVPARKDDPDAPLQLQITSLEYSSYVGKIGVGRILAGRVKGGQ